MTVKPRTKPLLSYRPDKFRSQSASNKQGSGGFLDGQYHPIVSYDFKMGEEVTVERGQPEEIQEFCQSQYGQVCYRAFAAYRTLIDAGVAKEQAREILPLCTYTSWIWTASLAAVVHFIKLRDEAHAQFEIREYAKAMRLLTEEKFPVSVKALLGE